MKRLAFLTAFCLLGIVSLADAGGRRFGSCYSSSYYYPSYGYSYYPSYSYQAPAVQYTAPAAAVATDWQTELAAAVRRDKDYANFREALGLVGGYSVNQVAKYTQPVQADTVYGYTYSQIQAAYGSTDMNVLYQQSARLTQGAQSAAQEANANFSSLVQQAGDGQARVAEILAKGKAAAEVARAAGKAVDAAPVNIQQTTVNGTPGTTVTGPGGVAVQQAIPADDAGTEAFMKTVARPLCASCHSGQTLNGKFDINLYPKLSAPEKAVVWERLRTTDPAKLMPRDAKDKTKPGVPLTTAQLAEFFRH